MTRWRVLKKDKLSQWCVVNRSPSWGLAGALSKRHKNPVQDEPRPFWPFVAPLIRDGLGALWMSGAKNLMQFIGIQPELILSEILLSSTLKVLFGEQGRG